MCMKIFVVASRNPYLCYIKRNHILLITHLEKENPTIIEMRILSQKSNQKLHAEDIYGTFCFTRISFGLKNAPIIFQRLIDDFRSGLKDIFIHSYLDNIIVLSETFEYLKKSKEIF